jgi:hypothetical protein
MDRMKQAQEAMNTANSPEAQQMQEQAIAAGGLDMQQGLADRGAIEAQTHEFQRISAVGTPAKALIKNITQTPEQVAGLPVWEIDLEVRIEGQEPYELKHREFAGAQSVQGYPVGGEWDCKVDPADPQKVSLWQF